MASNSTSDSAKRSSKRTSILPSLPKPPTSIDPSATIANHAILTGLYPITIGPRAVLHPYARIVSGDGPIEIGEGCIIWEKALVGSGSAAEDDSKRTEKVKKIVLGPNVVVESGAVVEAESVGEGTIIEAFSKIGDGTNVGKVKTPPNNRHIFTRSDVSEIVLQSHALCRHRAKHQNPRFYHYPRNKSTASRHNHVIKPCLARY